MSDYLKAYAQIAIWVVVAPVVVLGLLGALLVRFLRGGAVIEASRRMKNGQANNTKEQL